MIKKLLTIAASGIIIVGLHASVTINLSVGQLFGTTTSSVFPDGGLIQLVASTTDSVFTSPSVGAFTSNDDVVLYSFGLNQSTVGLAGSHTEAIISDFSGNLGAGDVLMLRWFPTLNASSNASSLVAGLAYGQFTNALTSVNGSNTWFVPADGQSIDLLFLNSKLGGAYNDNLGLAALTVTAVPEPATYAALLGLVTLGLVSYRRFRRS